MSKIKKFTGLLVAMIMVFAMAVTASAAETTYKLTINNTTVGHKYNVYQIFTGDLTTKDGKKVLSNVKYGANYGETGKDVPEEVLKSITDADDFAKSVTVTGTPVNVDSKAGKTEIDGLAAGYYLVKEVSETVPTGETYTKYIVQVVGNTEVKVKAGTTSFEKKIKDTNDTTGDVSGWQDSADYDVNDEIPFKLEATVASDYANYTSKYYLAFHDVEEEGLEFIKVDKVEIDGKEVKTGYTVTAPATDGDSFDVVFDNLKNTAAKAGDKIVVYYRSKLTDKAVMGSAGNVNKARLEYSNNPNNDQHGETPWDNVIVFTYKVEVNKVDENDAPLKGAGFTLYKKVGSEYEAVGNEIKGAELTQFKWERIDDGAYKIVETTIPAGYNKCADLEFTVGADHKIEWKDETRTAILTKLEGVDGNGNAMVDEKGNKVFTGNIGEGSLTTSIVNKAGATLPSTGGMGTKLFYLIGAICVIGAGILLISRKRVSR